MASIRTHPETSNYLVSFRFGGRQFTKSLGTKNKKDAVAHKVRIEETIRLIKSGRISLPENVDPGDFILSDGRAANVQVLPERVTLKRMFDFYSDTLPDGAKEENTLKGEQRHCEHFLRLIGPSKLASGISTNTIQDYVLKRAKEKWNGKTISPQTIKKELTTFRLIWNWCKDRGLLNGTTPTRGVLLPKTAEKPRFMTRSEIETILNRGGVSDDEEITLWNSLFLEQSEVAALLEYVKENARFRFVYPMFVFVAHTGVRRSEMMRSRIEDLNFENGVLLVREKKKSRVNSITFRHIEMSPLFESVLGDWISSHPGGQMTFCYCEDSFEKAREQLTIDATNYHFNHVLKNSKWDVVKGFHSLRHSFASNLAAAGVDQRVIDDFMGHQTEEMRRRYRHLFPKQRRQAILSAFS